jgi:hypothetical protein
MLRDLTINGKRNTRNTAALGLYKAADVLNTNGKAK